MERSHQIINDEGLQIPLPLIERYGFHSGVEVVVEMDAEGIRIAPAAPSKAEIENRALRVLWHRLGDAILVKAEPVKDLVHMRWNVTVYARGHETALGALHYSAHGELLSPLDEAVSQMIRKAGELAGHS
jgi:hypothetical protein